MSKLESLLKVMGGIDDPFELFEPFLWKDKIGDSMWHCEIRSVDAIIWYGNGDTALEAVEACYNHAMGSDLVVSDPDEYRTHTKSAQPIQSEKELK